MTPERQLKKHITKYDEQNLAQKVSPSSYRLPDMTSFFTLNYHPTKTLILQSIPKNREKIIRPSS